MKNIIIPFLILYSLSKPVFGQDTIRKIQGTFEYKNNMSFMFLNGSPFSGVVIDSILPKGKTQYKIVQKSNNGKDTTINIISDFIVRFHSYENGMLVATREYETALKLFISERKYNKNGMENHVIKYHPNGKINSKFMEKGKKKLNWIYDENGFLISFTKTSKSKIIMKSITTTNNGKRMDKQRCVTRRKNLSVN